MATNPPTSTPAAPAPLDWDKATKHLEAIKEKVMSYAGKAGMNPYMWWDEHGELLESKLKAGDKTPELHAMIMKFAFAEPKVPADLGVRIRRRTAIQGAD